MKKARYTESQIFKILKEAESGIAVPELCRKHGMSDASFYKWRAKYGGMDVSNMTRLRELEEENKRLKTMYAESRMDCDQARACWLFSVSQTCYRYRAMRSDDNARIADWLLGLAYANRTWGFGLC